MITKYIKKRKYKKMRVRHDTKKMEIGEIERYDIQ